MILVERFCKTGSLWFSIPCMLYTCVIVINRTLVDAYKACIEAAEDAASIYTSSLDTSLVSNRTFYT